MNVYTSDGLLVEQVADTGAQPLPADQGQQLISIYRLFLQLHHAGSGAMRLKDMLKPDAVDAAGENSNNGTADKTTDRRGNATRGALVQKNWSSVPSMPETVSAYSGSVAAISTGTPYPMFLLSSNAIPETRRLRGFASGRLPISTVRVLSKNNNRSCNGCEEIPLRWSLLTKKTAGAMGGYGMTSAPVTLNNNAAALHDKPASSPDRGGDGAGSGRSGVAASAQTTTTADAARADGTPLGFAVGNARTLAPPTTTTAVVPPMSRAALSDWRAAELQVHTTHRVLICTVTELQLNMDDSVEDGNTPLVFCCSVESSAP